MHSGASALSMAVGCMLADVKMVVNAAMAVGWRCEIASTVYGVLDVQNVERMRSCLCACVHSMCTFEVLYASFIVIR